eukprot:gene7536-9264_t
MFRYLDRNHQEMIKNYTKERECLLEDIELFQKVIGCNEAVRDWFLENRFNSLSPDIGYVYLVDAIRKGDFPRLKGYLDSVYHPYLYKSQYNYIQIAIELDDDRLDMVRYLDENQVGKFAGATLIPSFGADKGNIKVFTYLLNRHCLESFTPYVPIQLWDGNATIVNLLYHDSQYSEFIPKAPLDDSLFPNCFHNDVQLLKFFHDKRLVNFTTYSMDNAAKLGYIDIIKFLHFNRTEGCTFDGIGEAIKKDHVQVVKFLIENRCCSFYGVDWVNKFKFSHEMSICLEQILGVKIKNHLVVNPLVFHMSYNQVLNTVANRTDVWDGIIAEYKRLNFSTCSTVISNIFKFGDFKLLQLLETSDNFTFDMDLFKQSIISGRLSMVKYLTEKYLMTNISAYTQMFWLKLFKSVLSSGSLEVMDYLLVKIPGVWEEPYYFINNFTDYIVLVLQSKNFKYLDNIVTFSEGMDFSKLNLGTLYLQTDRPSFKVLRFLLDEYQMDLNYDFNLKELIIKCLETNKSSIIGYLLETFNFWTNINGRYILQKYLVSVSDEIRIMLIDSIDPFGSPDPNPELYNLSYQIIKKQLPNSVDLLFPDEQ